MLTFSLPRTLVRHLFEPAPHSLLSGVQSYHSHFPFSHGSISNPYTTIPSKVIVRTLVRTVQFQFHSPPLPLHIPPPHPFANPGPAFARTCMSSSLLRTP